MGSLIDWVERSPVLDVLTGLQVGILLAIALLGTFWRPQPDVWQHRWTQAGIWLLVITSTAVLLTLPLDTREPWVSALLRLGFLGGYACWLIARLRAVMPQVVDWWLRRGH